MQVEHHDLHHEFPDMNDAIDALKARNAHFAMLYHSYNRLTGKVEDLEEHDMPVADFTLEDMKKQRVRRNCSGKILMNIFCQHSFLTKHTKIFI